MPLIIILFFLGAVFGSFSNCLIWRLPRQESLVWPPSHCPACNHRLGILDLLPILSFIFLTGRCPYCHQKINGQYLVVEVLLGFLFGLSGLIYHNPADIIFFCFISVLFVMMTFIDLKHQILPDSLTFMAAGLGLLYNLLRPGQPLANFIFSGLLAALLFFIIAFISGLIWKQETLGGGDIKLALALGFIFGWPKVLLALFLSFFVGAILGLYLMVFRHVSKKDYMPFGPAMIAAAYLTIFWGDYLLLWYYRYLVL